MKPRRPRVVFKEPEEHASPFRVPLRECAGRAIEKRLGRGGGVQLVNARGGDLERLYGRQDPRYAAGVYVRTRLERLGGSLTRTLAAAALGESDVRVAAWSLPERRTQALDDLGWVCSVVGRTPYAVLLAYLTGLTLEGVDKLRRWPPRRAGAHLDSALTDLAYMLERGLDRGQKGACQVYIERLEHAQAAGADR
jgi:hypothetical protein